MGKLLPGSPLDSPCYGSRQVAASVFDDARQLVGQAPGPRVSLLMRPTRPESAYHISS